MHTSAFDFVRRVAQSLPPLRRVVEFGSRSVNGSVREIFTDARRDYLGIDVVNGPGVDLVADAADWRHIGEPFDAVVCCEVFEHTARAAEICLSAWYALKPGGVFVATCAGMGREPHSAEGDGPPRHGEFYRNVLPNQMVEWCRQFSVTLLDTDAPAGDLYALALRAR